MSKEFSASELDEYSQEHHGQFLVQARMVADGWRSFLLDEAEIRRCEIIEQNTPAYRGFDVFRAFASRLTGVSEQDINGVGLQGHVLTIIPVESK